jgi:predicted RNase H-like HicB family nuclease
MDSHYTIVVRREGPNYVALCVELNLLSQGKSLDQVKRNIVEAIREYLTLEERGLVRQAQPIPLDLLREFMTEGMDAALAANPAFLFSRN